MKTAPILAALLGLAAPACKPTEPAPSSVATPTVNTCYACEVTGACDVRGDGKCIHTAQTCARSMVCETDGSCGVEERDGKPVDDRCVVTEAGCAASIGCRRNGLCTKAATTCVATEAACAALEKCQEDGPCVIEGSNGCRTPAEVVGAGRKLGVPQDPACPDCARTGACNVEGTGPCLHTTESCAVAEDCKALGLCRAAANRLRCEATAEGCATSRSCRVSGDCGPPAAPDGACTTTALGCAQSMGCKDLGDCRLVDGRCTR